MLSIAQRVEVESAADKLGVNPGNAIMVLKTPLFFRAVLQKTALEETEARDLLSHAPAEGKPAATIKSIKATLQCEATGFLGFESDKEKGK